ncbi:MAG TPA: tRNA pseudouridine(55) synthase TruB [Patescibacteria group bacterium]|nr:tRNA pseudouridine(55) synthase TruB [Patescibacteria group bacterium]
MEGLLLVDKPEDWTSFDVVNYIRKIVATIENKKPKNIKVGHSGTLDPFATGLLIILIGSKYTKQSDKYLKQNKTYLVTAKLGYISTTGDPEGELSKKSDIEPSTDQIMQVFNKFKGVINQIPPIYSAIKIKGKKSYELAREGKQVIHKPRKVNIISINLLKYNYPQVELEVEVSSGTYIRSLVECIGEELTTGAYTIELIRTQIDGYSLDKAIKANQINRNNLNRLLIN